MEKLAEVLINRPSKHLDRTFTYRLPPELSDLTPGWRCVVPFNNRTEEGIILSVREEDSASLSYTVRDITAPLDDFAWFTPQMMALARWIASYYMCTYIDALRLFLIDKKGIRSEILYEICWQSIPQNHPIRELVDTSVMELSGEDAQLLWDADILSGYVNEGLLQKKEITKVVYHPPLEKWLIPFLEQKTDHVRGERQKALLTYLKDHGGQPVHVLEQQGFSVASLNTFCKHELGHFIYRPKKTYSLIRDPKNFVPRTLTREQQTAYKRICAAIDSGSCKGQLLMGVTGSGKTEVYLRAAEHALEQGGSVLILVPEIALTIQMVDYFSARFGSEVVFIHSKLSRRERYNNRARIQNGESHIVIGSRSALFMPYQNLKLIVVDEEYDTSYKQDETPRYNGRDAAKKLAVLWQCPIVLGAATPAVETYYAAKQGKIELLEMKERVHHVPLPVIHIVDMREEQGDVPYSRVLLESLQETIRAGKKGILFLNRRGYATVLQCRNCGYVFKCPHCDVSLVYHKERHSLHCHYCESVFSLPDHCPQCGGQEISYMGYGTEKAEEQIEQLLSGISCRRLDLDSTSRKYSALQILEDFRRGKFNVLLGTQMVAKGHDIPGVQMVGVISADSILNRPVYLAAEQAFILITQCAGRAGRGHEQGQVVLQTYNPDHYVIQAAVQQDYNLFYEKEIRFREALRYPPFVRMMKITCFDKQHSKAVQKAKQIFSWLKDRLSQIPDGTSATPPYDEPIRKVRNIYYVSIMIRGASLLALKTAMRAEPIFQNNGIMVDVDPLS